MTAAPSYETIATLIIGLFTAYLTYRARVLEQKQAAMDKNQQLADERAKEEALKTQATQNGVFALLKDRITGEYRRIMARHDFDEIDGPYVYLWELENVLKLNEEYHNLGGNGTVGKLMKEIQELPVRRI